MYALHILFFGVHFCSHLNTGFYANLSKEGFFSQNIVEDINNTTTRKRKKQ
jgi:transketolase N-terminal domain/subunit